MSAPQISQCIHITWDLCTSSRPDGPLLRTRKLVKKIMDATTTDYSESSEQLTARVVRAQGGDASAFGDLYEQFYPGILALLRKRLRQESDAQEIAQDVFIKAYTKLDQLRAPEAFAGWLRAIAVRMAINFVQRDRQTEWADFSLLEEVSSATAPVGVAMLAEQRTEVHRGLESLCQLDQQTLEAFYVRGCSIAEMSDEFAAPVGTIKRRLHVARHRLKAALGGLASVS